MQLCIPAHPIRRRAAAHLVHFERIDCLEAAANHLRVAPPAESWSHGGALGHRPKVLWTHPPLLNLADDELCPPPPVVMARALRGIAR